MSKIELSDKIIAVAESENLSIEDLQDMLTAGDSAPDELMEIFSLVADGIIEVSED